MAQEYDRYDQLTGVVVPASGWTGFSINKDLTTAKTLTSEVSPGDVTVIENTTPGLPILNSNVVFNAAGKATSENTIATVRGGSPGFGTDGMRVVWQADDNVWRGFSDHNVITDVDDTNKVFYGPLPNIFGTIYNVRNTTILSDGDGGSIILVGLQEEVIAQHYLPATSDLTSQRIISQRGTATSRRGTEDRSGAASTLPVSGYVDASGTVTCFHLVVNQAAGESGIRNDTYNLWTTRCDGSYRKDRYPASGFRTVGNWGIPVNLGFTADAVVQSMTCSADEEGNVLLFINFIPDATVAIPMNILVQLASNNGGLTFTLIDFGVTTLGGSQPEGPSFAVAIDTVYYNGSFLVMKAAHIFATNKTVVSTYKIPSPYISVRDISEQLIFDDLDGRVECMCLYTHQDGRAFAFLSASETTGASTSETYLLRTEDSGLTWDTYQTGFARNLLNKQITACEVDGTAVILTGVNNLAFAVEDPNNLMIIKAGGWESITNPRILNTAPYELYSYGIRKNVALTTSVLYLSQRIPSGFGGSWTPTFTGTTSESIGVGQPWLTVSKGTSSAIQYEAQLYDCTYSTGMTISGQMQHTSGGHLSVESIIRTGAQAYAVRVDLTATALRLVDVATNIVRGSYAVSSGTTVRFKLGHRAGEAQLFIRTSSGTWQSVVQTSAIGFTFATSLLGIVRFGIPALTGATEGKFFFIGAINNAGGGDQTYFSGTAQPAYNDDLSVWSEANHVPFGLHGAFVPVSGFGQLPLGQLKLSGSSGWSQRGETALVSTYSKYSLDKTLVASPSIKAKVEISSLLPVDLVYEISAGSGDRMYIGDAPAISIVDTDLDLISVSTSADGTTWNVLGDISFASEPALAFTRAGSSGRTLIPGVAAAGEKYYEINELVGCKVTFAGGVVARVISNTSGRFIRDGKMCSIDIEWAAGTPPQFGLCTISRREATAVFTNIPLPETFIRYIKLTIPPQRTANWTGSGQDWAAIGSILFGTYLPFSNKYSTTRAIAQVPNIVENVSRSGVSKVKKLGRSTKQIQISWAEGYDTTEASSSSPGSFISLPRGYDIAVGHRGAGTILEGIQRAVEDGELPLVYVPKIEVDNFINDYGDIYQWTMVGKDAALLCQMIDTVSRDVVIGEELTSEVVRMSGIVLKEIV